MKTQKANKKVSFYFSQLIENLTLYKDRLGLQATLLL